MANYLLKTSRFLLYLTLGLIPFYFFRFSILGIPTNVFEISVLVLSLATLGSLLFKKQKPIYGTLWQCLFLLAAAVSVFVSSDKHAALGIFKGWFVVPFLLYLATVNLIKKAEVITLLIPVYISFAIVSFWGVLQSHGVVELLFYQRNDPALAGYLQPDNFRIFGPFESPNYLAMYLVPVLFLVLPLIGYFKKFPKILFVLSLLPFAFGIYDILMTGSRGGMIAFAVGFLVLIFYRIKSAVKFNKLAITMSIAALLFLGGLYLNQTFKNRSGSDNSRFQIYNYSLQMAKENPILGIGLGNFKSTITTLSDNNPEFQSQTLPFALHPHNLFLAVWLNVGLVGLALFLLILTKFFKELTRQSDPLNIALIAAMLAILIHGLFDTTYFKNDLSVLFWLILGLAYISDAKNLSKN